MSPSHCLDVPDVQDLSHVIHVDRGVGGGVGDAIDQPASQIPAVAASTGRDDVVRVHRDEISEPGHSVRESVRTSALLLSVGSRRIPSISQRTRDAALQRLILGRPTQSSPQG